MRAGYERRDVALRQQAGVQTALSLIAVAAGAGVAWAGWRRHDRVGLGMMIAGGLLAGLGLNQSRFAYRSAKQATQRWRDVVNVRRRVMIARPRAMVYAFCRDLHNLADCSEHVLELRTELGNLAQWRVRGPEGRELMLLTRIVEDLPGERVEWRSVPGTDMRSAGVLIFRDVPDGRGTELYLHVAYEPPPGGLGRELTELLSEEPGQQAVDLLLEMKHRLEHMPVGPAAHGGAHVH